MSLSPAGSVAVCSGSYATVQIIGNVSAYAWAPIAGLSITNNTISVSPNVSQTFTITGTLNSCTTTAILVATIVPLPLPVITAGNNKLCVNTLLQMQGSGGSQFNWAGPLGFSSTQQDLSTVLSSSAAAGIYSLTVTGLKGCKNATTTTIDIGDSPTGELAGLRLEGCAPLCSNYYFQPAPQQPAVVSNWEVNGQSYGNQFYHCFANSGTVTLKGTITNTSTTCTNTISYLINVLAQPKADFVYSPQVLLADRDEVKFTSTSIGDNQMRWFWYFNGNYTPDVRSASGKNVVNRFAQAGAYAVAMVLTNTNGCSDTIVKALVVNEDFTLFVPNTFTPNNDLRNDVFFAMARGLKTFSLKIFNRGGNLVFESQDQTQGWDGTFKGDPAQEGNYIWQINYSAGLNQVTTRTGQLLLTR